MLLESSSHTNPVVLLLTGMLRSVWSIMLNVSKCCCPWHVLLVATALDYCAAAAFHPMIFSRSLRKGYAHIVWDHGPGESSRGCKQTPDFRHATHCNRVAVCRAPAAERLPSRSAPPVRLGNPSDGSSTRSRTSDLCLTRRLVSAARLRPWAVLTIARRP